MVGGGPEKLWNVELSVQPGGLGVDVREDFPINSFISPLVIIWVDVPKCPSNTFFFPKKMEAIPEESMLAFLDFSFSSLLLGISWDPATGLF